eukprot:SAG31_NODE_2066_length_6527_cov_6.499378_2_plen_84_part_00
MLVAADDHSLFGESTANSGAVYEYWNGASWDGTVGLGGAGAITVDTSGVGVSQTVLLSHASPVPLVLGGFATGQCPGNICTPC